LLVQFRDYLANECSHPEKYNCTSCDKRLKCLEKGSFEIESFIRDNSGRRIKFRIDSINDIWAYIDKAKAYNIEQGNPTMADFQYFVAHEICPVPLFESDIVELLNMIDLTEKISADKYLDTPAAFIRALNIVNSERNRLAKIRMAK
jgi:hypothetical protein